MADPMTPGTVGWMDLTVPDAVQVRDFYRDVVGWTPQPVNMGTYEDFAMARPADGQVVAGICHARGGNANLPPLWVVYLTVANLDESLAKCVALGGKQLGEVRSYGASRYCLIQDPAGAICSLFQQA